MNPSVLLLAGALVLAAPLGYMTLAAADDAGAAGAAQGPLAPASVDAAPAPNLFVRLQHDGAPVLAKLSVAGRDGATMRLVEGETVLPFHVDPRVEHVAELAVEARHPLDPVGITGGRFHGSAAASFAECDVIEVLFQTLSRSESGIVVHGAACVPGPQRHVAVEAAGPMVVVPYPTCPTSCSMGYGLGGSRDLVFEVPEGATRIDVRARWNAENPMTERLQVWLLAPDPACGDGCWSAVEVAEGAEQVAFSYAAPAPGEYGVTTFFTTRAGAAVQQDVWLEAIVHTS